MTRPLRGFTLIELLIIISTLGILLGIVTVGWSAVNVWSRDRAREQDTKQWASTFDLYKSRYVVYPALPTGDGNSGTTKFCLGSFPSVSGGPQYNNKCGQYNSTGTSKFIDANDSSPMLALVKNVGNIPTNNGPAVNSTFVGPFVYLYQTTAGDGTVNLEAYFLDFFENSCSTGSGFTDATTDSKVYPGVSALVAGYSGTVNLCYIKKTASYKP